MTGASDWQGRVGRAWADEWRRTDRSFAALNPHLLSAIAAQPGMRLLDVGCGAGEISLAAARARPAATVTGIDISADLIAAAGERAAETGARNVRFRHADAGEFVDSHGPADLLMSRHGVMFFSDPPAVFRHLARHAAPGARLVFSCFRARHDNPWANLFDAVLPPGPPAPETAGAPGPFAFADPDHVRQCLAGWADIAFQLVDFGYAAGSGDDPVADALGFFSRIGPAAPRLAGMADSDRGHTLDAMARVLDGHRQGGTITLPSAAWVVTASADRA